LLGWLCRDTLDRYDGAAHVRHWQRLLRYLARYGDRVEIVLSEALRHRAAVDSSVFTLRLDA